MNIRRPSINFADEEVEDFDLLLAAVVLALFRLMHVNFLNQRVHEFAVTSACSLWYFADSIVKLYSVMRPTTQSSYIRVNRESTSVFCFSALFSSAVVFVAAAFPLSWRSAAVSKAVPHCAVPALTSNCRWDST